MAAAYLIMKRVILFLLIVSAARESFSQGTAVRSTNGTAAGLTTTVATTNTGSNFFQGEFTIPSSGQIMESATASVVPTSNPQLGFRASPYSSGGGIDFYSTGTNLNGGTKYAQAGTTNFYFYDPFFGSIVATPQEAGGGTNGVKGLLPGTWQFVVNGAPTVFSSTVAPGGLAAGNYPFYWISPTNGVSYWPQLQTGKFFPTGVTLGGNTQPADASFSNVMTMDHTSKEVDFGGKVVTGGVLEPHANVNGTHFTLDVTGVAVTIGDVANTNGTFTGWKFITTRTAQTYSGPTMQINDSGEGLGNYAGNTAGVGLYTLDDATNSPAFKIDNHFSGRADEVTAKSNLLAKHFGGFGTAQTVNIKTNGAGFGATASGDANASDVVVTVTLTTGLGPAANTPLFTNAFNTSFTTSPHIVFSANDGNASAVMTNVFVTNISTTGFEFWPGTAALAASKVYHFTFHIIQ